MGQNSCSCNNNFEKQGNIKPDTIIELKPNQKLAICGFFDSEFITEFTVIKCNENKFLDFYSAILHYKIEVNKDTLELIDYRILPNSAINFTWTPWAIDQYYFVDSTVKHTRKVIYQIDKSIIPNKEFFNEWNEEPKATWSPNEKLVGWTFLLALNNKDFYYKYFETYRDTFQIGGATAEYYNELNNLLLEKTGNLKLTY